jgi:hypothetical protein
MRVDRDDLAAVHDDGGVPKQMPAAVDHPRRADDDGVGEGGGGEEDNESSDRTHG